MIPAAERADILAALEAVDSVVKFHELSPREFAVLEMLLLRHGRVVSKAQLQDHLTHFGGDLGDTAIEVYVHRVRKKLENCRVEIVTVRGFGYLLQEIRQAA